ncbi:MAG: serpin family protein [Alphaproteobacteria bacterium]|nr:serpin family protein [Alphaproteobacteria bacterium]
MPGKIGKSAIIAITLIATALSLPRQPLAATADINELSRGTAALTLSLYRQMSGKEDGNIFFSPYSISEALGMAYAGARGKTAEEMARVLGFTLPADKLYPAIAESSRSLMASGNSTGQSLNIANAIWLKTGFAVLPAYNKLLKDNFSNESYQLDFCQAAQSAKTINEWVEKETKDHIHDLISEKNLDCMTRLVLTNAVYFKGDWLTPFKHDSTSPGSFWTGADKKMDATFMHRQGHYEYGEDDAFQILRLPYKNDLAMLVLLPKAKDGLAAAEKNLNALALEKLDSALKPEEVVLSFPKFESDTKYSLSDYLIKAGMKEAFGNAADFSGITAQEPLRIDAVLHKAWIKVDEKGTEAAAATAVSMLGTAAFNPNVKPPVIFNADHPFLFMIKDRKTGMIIFWGRISSPKDAPAA